MRREAKRLSCRRRKSSANPRSVSRAVGPHANTARPVLRRAAVTAPNLASVALTSGATNTDPSERSHPNAPASPIGLRRQPSTAAFNGGWSACDSAPLGRRRGIRRTHVPCPAPSSRSPWSSAPAAPGSSTWPGWPVDHHRCPAAGPLDDEPQRLEADRTCSRWRAVRRAGGRCRAATRPRSPGRDPVRRPPPTRSARSRPQDRAPPNPPTGPCRSPARRDRWATRSTVHG